MTDGVDGVQCLCKCWRSGILWKYISIIEYRWCPIRWRLVSTDYRSLTRVISISMLREQRHLIFVDIWSDGKVVYLTYLSLGGMSTDSSIESISWRNWIIPGGGIVSVCVRCCSVVCCRPVGGRTVAHRSIPQLGHRTRARHHRHKQRWYSWTHHVIKYWCLHQPPAGGFVTFLNFAVLSCDG